MTTMRIAAGMSPADAVMREPHGDRRIGLASRGRVRGPGRRRQTWPGAWIGRAAAPVVRGSMAGRRWRAC